MLDDAARARRRELEHKAYAPGGRLSDAEADELRALSVEAAPTAAAPAAVPERPERPERDERPAQTPPVPEQGDGPPTEPLKEPLEEPRKEPLEDPPADAPEPAQSRRRWLAPLAVVLTLVVGFAAGWLAFGRDDGAPAMTDAQRDTWVELQSSDLFDPGSVRLVGSQFGVDAWSATKDDGKNECFTLTGGEGRSQSPICQPSDRNREVYDLQASISVKDGEQQLMVWAVLAQDTLGNDVAIMQRQDTNVDWDWRDQFTADELPIAEFLDSKGFTGDSLQIIGYDGETPVWLHQYEQGCVIVATADEVMSQACGELTPTQSLDLSVPGATYSVRMTEMRGPMLTVVRTTPTGDPVDCPECNSIDDKTGE